MKLKVIMLVISLALCITCVIVGFTCGVSTPDEPYDTNTSDSPSTDTYNDIVTEAEIEDIKTLNVPKETFYYIGGTHIEYIIPVSNTPDLPLLLPSITFGDTEESIKSEIDGNNAYTFRGNGIALGTALSQDNQIIFTDMQSSIQDVFPINIEHEDWWYQEYGAKQEQPWKCTYDDATQTVTITHNSDFAMFRLFENDEAYIQYISDHFLQPDTNQFEIQLYPNNSK